MAAYCFTARADACPSRMGRGYDVGAEVRLRDLAHHGRDVAVDDENGPAALSVVEVLECRGEIAEG